MSTPGPDVISACPHCRTPARTPTCASIFFLGSSTWSDGAQWTLPGPPSPIVACAKCHKCFHQHDAVAIESAGPFDRAGAEAIRARWGHLPYIREPDELEYYAAIARGDFPATPEAQREVRLHAWWKRNFPARQMRSDRASVIALLDATALSAEARHNLEELIPLLASDDERDRLLMAEVYRELGRFAEATQVLRTLQSTEAAPTVERLLGLCEAGDSRVAELASEGWLNWNENFGAEDDEPGEQ